MSAGLSAAFLVNFMFWTGLAAGATAFAALLDLTGAEWAAALRSDARRFRYFLPVAVPLYLLMLLGARRLYPWISQPIGSSWLRFGPFVVRDLGALTALAGAGVWFWSRAQETTARAAWFLVAYAVGFSILAIDLLMSLAAPWGSTLFPAYFFVANAYAAIAAVGLVTLRRARGGLSEASRSDLQKLLLGFSLLWMYLVWSQFIVIWYGNLRSEVGYLKAVCTNDGARSPGSSGRLDSVCRW